MEEVQNIVIVGAGIAGIAAALGLHRLGLKSLVLESADRLRTSGFTIGTWPNAWRALDGLGVADGLRRRHLQLCGFVSISSTSGKVLAESKLNADQFEIRILRRNLLLEALEKELPRGTIRFSAKVVSVEDVGDLKLLRLADGSTIRTKVLVGCDGVNSVVAKSLALAAPMFTGRVAVRAIAEFPEGHGLKRELLQCLGDGFRSGFAPVDDKLVYWFFTWSPSNEEEDLEECPIKVKQFVLGKLGKLDSHAVEILERTELSNILVSKLRSCWPFDLLRNRMYQGNICLAGDAFHAMTPDLGQGGCAALEDGFVLARCLGAAFLGRSGDIGGDEHGRVKKGIEMYVKERRWRCFQLVCTAYVVGRVQQSSGRVTNFLRDNLLASLMAKRILAMTEYNCGELSFNEKL